MSTKKLSIKDRETLSKGIVGELAEFIRNKRDVYIQSEEYTSAVNEQVSTASLQLDKYIEELKAVLGELAVLTEKSRALNKDILNLTGKQPYMPYLGCTMSSTINIQEYRMALDSHIKTTILDKELIPALSEQKQKELVIFADLKIFLSENQDPGYLKNYVLQELKKHVRLL